MCACHCVYAHVRVCARVCSTNYNHSTRNMTQLPAKFILQHIDDDIIPQDLSTAPPIHNHLHHDYTTQSYSTVAYSCNYQEISINQPKNATANQHTDANSISPATDHDIPETNPTVSYQEDTWVPCACKRHSNKTCANDDACVTSPEYGSNASLAEKMSAVRLHGRLQWKQTHRTFQMFIDGRLEYHLIVPHNSPCNNVSYKPCNPDHHVTKLVTCTSHAIKCDMGKLPHYMNLLTPPTYGQQSVHCTNVYEVMLHEHAFPTHSPHSV